MLSVCLDVGQVYSCGSDYYGCLGIGNAMGDEVLCLTQLDFFSSKPVEEISCGDNHCVALTKDGDVYTWGCGEFGEYLGLMSKFRSMINTIYMVVYKLC